MRNGCFEKRKSVLNAEYQIITKTNVRSYKMMPQRPKWPFLFVILQLNPNNKTKLMKSLFSKISLLALTLMIVSFSGMAQSVDDVIAKHIAATGGEEKWKQVNSLKVEGYIEVQGIQIPFTQQTVHNTGMRIDAEFQGMQIIQIVTPTKSWSQNPFGGKSELEPASEEEHKQQVDELDIQNEFVDYKNKGSKVELLGKDEEDGNEYFKVRLTTKNDKQTVYYFDVKTYLVYKTVSTNKMQGQEMEMTTKMYDYKELPIGVKVPHKTDQMGQVLVFEKIEANATIDTKIFAGK